MRNPEGPPPQAEKPGQIEFELSAKEEEEVVDRIAVVQERMLKMIREWTQEKHHGQPIDAEEVRNIAHGISTAWLQFTVHDLLGISEERFLEILEKQGF